jgi:phosphotransferase system HPr (HPr) family protein
MMGTHMSSELQRRTVLVANPQGLHMRPSAAFAQLAGQFQSEVVVIYDGKTANGKSIWDLMGLAAMPGAELTLEVAGPDAEKALDALAALVATVPGEN